MNRLWSNNEKRTIYFAELYAMANIRKIVVCNWQLITFFSQFQIYCISLISKVSWKLLLDSRKDFQNLKMYFRYPVLLRTYWPSFTLTYGWDVLSWTEMHFRSRKGCNLQANIFLSLSFTLYTNIDVNTYWNELAKVQLIKIANFNYNSTNIKIMLILVLRIYQFWRWNLIV